MTDGVSRETPSTPSPPRGRRAQSEMLVLGAMSLAISIATSVYATGWEQLATLGACFDGHLYIEIAKSFPLPFGPGANHYLGHAPAYPALIYLARLLTPDLVNWGQLALAVSWLGGVGAVLAFYQICRELGLPGLQASATFMVLNPAWIIVISAPTSEPWAVCFALLCFRSHLRGSLVWSLVWLSLAMFSRFPFIMLGLPLAFDLLIVQRQIRVRNIVLLAQPVLLYGLYNLFLAVRVPGSQGVWGAHQVHWPVHWVLPFSQFSIYWDQLREAPLFVMPIVCVTIGFYALSIGLGLSPKLRRHTWLPLWVAVMLLLPVSLSGALGVMHVTRIVLPAWPAALLITWLWLRRPLPPRLVGSLCVVMAVFGVWLSQTQIAYVVRIQPNYPMLWPALERLDSNEPYWIDFRRTTHRKRPIRHRP